MDIKTNSSPRSAMGCHFDSELLTVDIRHYEHTQADWFEVSVYKYRVLFNLLNHNGGVNASNVQMLFRSLVDSFAFNKSSYFTMRRLSRE